MENETDRISVLLDQALSEDLHTQGDITSQAIFTANESINALIKSKDHGVLAGSYLVELLFKKIDPTILVSDVNHDGTILKPGSEICHLRGPIQGILLGERIILNFMQRLSGIATHTAVLVSKITHTSAKLLDTRKTTPILRILEKNAVLSGGGYNHRFGLFDMILIKDTHVKAVGSPSQAVIKSKEYCRTHNELNVKIEVEVQSLDEFYDAVSAAPDRIMLDNMSISDMTQCVKYIKNKVPSIELEASGNITADTITSVAHTGVDYISSGAITHSSKALDLHLIVT